MLHGSGFGLFGGELLNERMGNDGKNIEKFNLHIIKIEEWVDVL